MSPEDTTALIKQVLAEQRVISSKDIDTTSLKTIATILTSFGIEEDDRFELKADFSHLRKWRKGVEQVERIGIGTVVTVILTGFCGMLWVGFKTMIGK